MVILIISSLSASTDALRSIGRISNLLPMPEFENSSILGSKFG